MGIVIVMNRARKRVWRRQTRRCRDADERQRYRIIGMLAEGRSAATVADGLGCARATVVRVAQRYRAEGEAGLVDHRRFNGSAKVTAAVLRHHRRSARRSRCLPRRRQRPAPSPPPGGRMTARHSS